ncbi:ATP binding protein, putative [Ricinus communis]|uniref:ATP binding protein, putative n=1 Tax=Ricinus communis TaxID=3988 RepID=B9RBK6_RICCO|nr:ATP binding protein, putative [Ricinus communis]
MANLISDQLCFRALALLLCLLLPVLGQNLLSCETTSPDASGYRCNINGSQDHCKTFAILSTNSYFSSLSNLSFYLGFNRFVIAEANGFSADTEFLPKDQPLLIPIDCKCNGNFFRAEVTKTTIKGENFYGIAESLEGLTTCKAIQENNLGVSPWNLADKARLLVPLRCACPSSSQVTLATRFLLSYPVSEGDTISNIAIKFNTTPEAIISANNRSLANFKPENLVPLASLLIPLNREPALGSLAKPREPNSPFRESSIPVINPHKKKSKMWMIGVYIAVTGVVVGATIAIVAAFLIVQLKKKKKQNLSKDGDPELQQLSLSVRTTSEKKVSFEGSQQDLDNQIIDTTPRNRKVLVENYTVEELRKATEDFSSSSLIDGSVYYGRLNGKNLAIKRTKSETISKIDFSHFQNATHHHPNIIRLLGTCLSEGSDSFLVFEYAKNGSLKDWLHGGLAMKNQFIASCYCFLTWNQRLKICLDVAVALQYMHHIMNPSYVHRNVKSRNIFLDEEFNAKIGNFGMARCIEGDTQNTEIHSTNPSSWSLGYLAPEYIHQGIVSPCIDIFAFGVVLLEVLSGKRPITRPDNKGEESNLLSEKMKSILSSENAGELREWMDNALGENYSFDTAVTLANLARSCVEEEPSLRPNAGELVEKLSRLVEESSEGEQVVISESSSKPLVKAAAAL